MPIKKINLLFAIITAHLFFAPSLDAQKPLALHPKSPQYFTFHNKATILITSGEHYGTVLNPDFDYITYLNTLASHGLNLTRTFIGSYYEPGDAFNTFHNTLAPAPGKFICPWARATGPGAAARQRSIIIEFAFFCPFYEEGQWLLSPMNSINNINGAGSIARTDVYTLDKNGGLLTVQEKWCKK